MKSRRIENFHIHTNASDGKIAPEKTIETAKRLRLKYICITDHYPSPPGFSSWGRDYFSPSYVHKLEDILKEHKNDKMETGFGAEFNWVTEHENWFKKNSKKLTLTL